MSTSNEQYHDINGRELSVYIKRSLDGCDITVKHTKHVKNKIFITIQLLPVILLTLSWFNYARTFTVSGAITLICFVIYSEIYRVKCEKVLVIPFVGIQYTTEFGWNLERNNFIHWQNLDGLFINEVIQKQRILYVLTVMIKDTMNNSSLVTLFTNTKPRLKCLEIMYQEMQTVLDNKSINNVQR